MKKIPFSKISFYCSMIIVSCFILMLVVIAIFPSPAACEGLADLFTMVGGGLGALGLVFSILGIKEPNSAKKWIGITINAIMLYCLIHDLMIYNTIG